MTIAQLLSKMLLLLDRIGRSGPVILPYDPKPPRGHNDPERYVTEQNALLDYYRADALYSKISKDRDNAKERCIALGVFGDFHNHAAGKSIETYNNGVVAATVTTNKAATKVDPTKLENQLHIELGRAKTEALIKKCQVTSKPARIVKVLLLSDNEE